MLKNTNFYQFNITKGKENQTKEIERTTNFTVYSFNFISTSHLPEPSNLFLILLSLSDIFFVAKEILHKTFAFILVNHIQCFIYAVAIWNDCARIQLGNRRLSINSYNLSAIVCAQCGCSPNDFSGFSIRVDVTTSTPYILCRYCTKKVQEW